MLFNGAVSADQKFLDCRPMLRLGAVQEHADGCPLKGSISQVGVIRHKPQSYVHLSPAQLLINTAEPGMGCERLKCGFPSHNKTIAYYNATGNS